MDEVREITFMERLKNEMMLFCLLMLCLAFLDLGRYFSSFCGILFFFAVISIVISFCFLILGIVVICILDKEYDFI